MERKNLKLQKKSPRYTKKSTSPPWIELPRDVTANILHRLGAKEILKNVQKVCTTWRSVCKDPSMWRVIHMINFGNPTDGYFEGLMLLHAIDRSQGQLTNISLKGFGTDESLLYISERASQLKRVTIAQNYFISCDGLRRACGSFPHLEELHLLYVYNVSAQCIEGVGRVCPKLKSFTFNQKGEKKDPRVKGNGIAIAVSKSMHGLRHLQLFGNVMNNVGLQAILDGCLHVESIDLRQCFNIDLDGDLGKRLSKQIKCVKYPNDSTYGYGWNTDVHDSRDSTYFSDSDSDRYFFDGYESPT